MDDWYPTPSGGKGRKGSDRRSTARRWIARLVVVGGFLAFVVGVAYFVNWSIDWFHERSTTTTTEEARGPAVKVTVNPGMTASEVGRLLEEKGVIDSSSAFVDKVKERGTEERLLPGIYQFYKGQTLLEVVDMLEQGEGSPSFKLTIPEGLSVAQIGDLLNEEGSIEGSDYVDLSSEPGKFVVPDVGSTTPKVTTLEGLLFPSTYYMFEGDGATELIGSQLAAFRSKTASLPWEKAATLGMTPYEIVIVASLIEKEASVEEERAKVAAVIYNRIKEDMTLGIDATVRYALNKWKGALTDEELAVESPYNTRVLKGLPPTPISNPGLAALEAALSPADVDYLYYVLSDTDGHHFFTASYDEFLEAKENQPDQ
jgi:UPF0755 protein